MKIKNVRMFLISIIAAIGVIFASVPAMAADIDTVDAANTGDHGYYNSWNGISGIDIEDQEVKEVVIKAASGDSKKSSIDSTIDVLSGAATNSSAKNKNGNSPDLDISFDVSDAMNGITGLFTPEGNLTLVDDIDEDEGSILQYMTVQTKSGAYFYIVVDRSSDENNVYFLNTVDEADLMALMDDDTREQFKETEDKNDIAETVGFMNAEDSSEESSEDKTSKDDESKKGSTGNPIAMLLIFVLLGGGAAIGYYKFKIQPQKQLKSDEDEMEFYDDEEYEEDSFESEDSDWQGEDEFLTDDTDLISIEEQEKNTNEETED